MKKYCFILIFKNILFAFEEQGIVFSRKNVGFDGQIKSPALSFERLLTNFLSYICPINKKTVARH